MLYVAVLDYQAISVFHTLTEEVSLPKKKKI